MRAYALIVDKGGAKLRESAADSTEPIGCAGGRAEGMANRECRNVSMAVLARGLPAISPHYIDAPVVNDPCPTA
jgi:uncharacterized protein (TIGR03435 family)